MQSNIQGLREKKVTKQELANYMCTQDFLNAYVGYKNYLRQCMLTTDFDAGYDAAIAEWNEGCLPFFTAVPNTPPVTPLTATHTPDSCQSAYSLCVMWGDADTSCSSSHASSTAAYSSCVCRSDVLAFASGCEVDGSVNCFRKTPDPATMWGAVYCSVTPGIPSPGGTGPAVTFAPGAPRPGSASPSMTTSTSMGSRNAGGFHFVITMLSIWLVLSLWNN